MVRFIALTFLALTITSQSYADNEDWLPQARHYEAANQGSDCAIYRSIAYKSRVALDQAQDQELHFSELLKVRRSELVACAEIRGIEMDGSDEAEEMAAEVCNPLYQQWVQTGYRLRAVRQERDSSRKSLAVLSSNLERQCGHSFEAAPSTIRIE